MARTGWGEGFGHSITPATKVNRGDMMSLVGPLAEVERAAADRRMSRAHSTLRYRGSWMGGRLKWGWVNWVGSERDGGHGT